MGKYLTSYSIAIGDGNVYFLNPHFNFIERKKINVNNLLETNESSFDTFYYDFLNCGKNSFKKNYENIIFIQIMINIHKPKPIKYPKTFWYFYVQVNVEIFLHFFMHLCLVRV